MTNFSCSQAMKFSAIPFSCKTWKCVKRQKLDYSAKRTLATHNRKKDSVLPNNCHNNNNNTSGGNNRKTAKAVVLNVESADVRQYVHETLLKPFKKMTNNIFTQLNNVKL